MEIKIEGQRFEINKGIVQQAEIKKSEVGGHSYIQLMPKGATEGTWLKVNDIINKLNKETGVFNTKENKEIAEIKAALKERAGDFKIKMSASNILNFNVIGNLNKKSNQLMENNDDISKLLSTLSETTNEKKKNMITNKIENYVEIQKSLLNDIQQNKDKLSVKDFNSMSSEFGKLTDLEQKTENLVNFFEHENKVSELLVDLSKAQGYNNKSAILSELDKHISSQKEFLENDATKPFFESKINKNETAINHEKQELLKNNTKETFVGALFFLENLGKRFAYNRESLPLVKDPVEREQKETNQKNLIAKDENQLEDILKTIDAKIEQIQDPSVKGELSSYRDLIKNCERSENGIRTLMESGIKETLNPPNKNILEGNITRSIPHAFGDNHLLEGTDIRHQKAVSKLVDLYIANYVNEDEKQNFKELKSIINEFTIVTSEFNSGSVDEKAEAFTANLKSLQSKLEKLTYKDDTSFDAQIKYRLNSLISPTIAYLEVEKRDGITLKSLDKRIEAKNENVNELLNIINNKKQSLETIKNGISATTFSEYSEKLNNMEKALKSQSVQPPSNPSRSEGTET